MSERNTPMLVFISSFLISSLAGLATLLRTGDIINRKSVVSSMLNSGILGLAVSLIWYTQYRENIYFLVGVTIICGLGAPTLIDFAISRLKIKINSSLNITENSDEPDQKSLHNSE